jgi:hypothetical protein
MVTISERDTVTTSKPTSTSRGRWLLFLVAVLAVLTVASLTAWMLWDHTGAPSPAQLVPPADLPGGSVYQEQVPAPGGSRVNGPGSSVYDEQVPQAHQVVLPSRVY